MTASWVARPAMAGLMVGMLLSLLPTHAQPRSVPASLDTLPFLPTGYLLFVSPSYGVPGTLVSLAGTGFLAGETVQVSFDGAPLATGVTDSHGTYRGLAR